MIKKSFSTKLFSRYSDPFNNDKFIYSILGLLILFLLAARIHLLSFPFERDEGEYAYMGKLILDGHAPYTLAYNMKLPGTYYMYALSMWLFGKSIVGVHIGLTIISLSSTVLVFFISKHFVSKLGAIISCATFGILATSWTLLAQAAHANHFVTFFALLGIYILLQIYKKQKEKLLHYFISGLFFSLAFICKQSGLFFLFFGFTIIFIKEFKNSALKNILKKLLLYSIGFVGPLIIMLLYFYLFGDFKRFWFWTITYLSEYNNQVPISEAFDYFKTSIQIITGRYSSLGYVAIWIVSIIGIPFIFINMGSKRNKLIIFLFFILSFLTIVPGFYFRPHYFITLLPVVGLLVAGFFEFFNNLFIHKIKLPLFAFLNFFIFIILVGLGVNSNFDYLFTRNNNISCKLIYGPNPFIESLEIGDFLQKNTTKEDKIATIGSEPQICFYADRYSATGYIYTYNLVELHPYALSMQKEMAQEIESNKPKYILFVNIWMSWLDRPSSEKYLINWAQNYISQNYKLVGLCDVMPYEYSSLKIYDQLNGYQPKSQDLIYIYERLK
ncbi:MAG: glycosyltransferase family 39 protein [Bacteroidetes bacterium]|nr:glycosyltransferase family 39 protein [Bacteroidota bacterium]